jgi:hypothetical protein
LTEKVPKAKKALSKEKVFLTVKVFLPIEALKKRRELNLRRWTVQNCQNKEETFFFIKEFKNISVEVS